MSNEKDQITQENTIPDDAAAFTSELDRLQWEPDGMAEDTIRVDADAIREKLASGDTMQFTPPGEKETEAVDPVPEKKTRKKGRRGRRKKEKAAKGEAVSGDTVRLDRGAIAAKAAELRDQTVRFEVPASQEAAERTREQQPVVRVYEPGKGPKPILYEEDLLTREDMERIAQAARQQEKEQQASQPELELHTRGKKQKQLSPPTPAERQYEQAAQGLSGAQTRLFFASVLTIASLILTALAAFGVLNFRGGASFLPFLQMVILLLCALMTYDVAVEGLMGLFRLRPGIHTVLTVLLVFSCIEGVQCILSGRTSYGGLTCLCLTMGLWSDCQERSRICNTMEVIRRGGVMDAAVREPALWEGKDGILRGEGDMDTFLRDQERVPGAQRVLQIYCLAVMAVCLVVSFLTGGGSFVFFTRVFVTMLLASVPALSLIAVSRPRAMAAGKLKYHGAALSGWEGGKNTRGSIVVPLSDLDLFPGDKLRMNGMKLYPDVDPDKTIAYGAALICASGSGLAGIFSELLEKKNLRKCKIENLKRYDNGGISGEVGKDSVLAGSMAFMQAMGVELPEGTRVNQAVYVAVNGFLGGVFAINYTVSRAAIRGLGTLVRSSGVMPVLTAQDFVITPGFIHSRFRVNTNRIVFPVNRKRAALAARRPSEEARQCAILTKTEFASLAKAVSCGRAMYYSALWCTGISLLSGIIGLGITGFLAWIGSMDILTAGNLLLYTVLWDIPLWIISGWVRNA